LILVKLYYTIILLYHLTTIPSHCNTNPTITLPSPLPSATEAKGTVLLKSAADLLNYNKSEEKKMEEVHTITLHYIVYTIIICTTTSLRERRWRRHPHHTIIILTNTPKPSLLPYFNSHTTTPQPYPLKCVLNPSYLYQNVY
jgi:hypothetical protein